MKTVLIKKSVDFEDIEEVAQQLLNAPDVKLRLPNSLREAGAIGLEGLVSQLIATWLRNGDGEKIFHTYADSRNVSSFEDLCSKFYGICALRLSDQILDSEGSNVNAFDVLRPAYSSIDKVNKGDMTGAFKGAYVVFPSFKAIGSNKEFNSPFYNGENVVGGPRFRSLTQSAIDAVIPERSRRSLVDDAVIDNIAEIVRELFTNTHIHARKDEHGNIYEKNFRAVIIKSVLLSQARLDELNKRPRFAQFVANLPDFSGHSLPVLDVTVIDAGPGYARRWLGLPKNQLIAEDEIDAVLKCFSKHGTSQSHKSAGSGLNNVLSDLRKLGGWMRLRTGRVEIEKSFFAQLGEPTVTRDDIRIKDVFLDGSSFNIVIPLLAKKG